eukprot:366391-Chlamydomonas_euryale.AAC.18
MATVPASMYTNKQHLSVPDSMQNCRMRSLWSPEYGGLVTRMSYSGTEPLFTSALYAWIIGTPCIAHPAHQVSSCLQQRHLFPDQPQANMHWIVKCIHYQPSLPVAGEGGGKMLHGAAWHSIEPHRDKLGSKRPDAAPYTSITVCLTLGLNIAPCSPVRLHAAACVPVQAYAGQARPLTKGVSQWLH